MGQSITVVPDEMELIDVVSNVFVEVATLAFVFFMGAAVGSFVNVILYRLPRRMNLLWPPSRCPVCLHRLKLVDNLPVVSWLRLRGKCRHCRTPIPRSYLRVEVGFGLLFLVVLYTEIHTGGLNLPLRSPNQYLGALWNLWYPKPDLVRIWLYHLAMAAFLGTLYLFAHRGEWLPTVLPVAGVVVALLLAWQYPGLHLVPVTGDDRLKTGVREAAAGAGMGVLLGVVLGALGPRRDLSGASGRPGFALPPWAEAAAFLAVAGGYLGWQAAISAAVLTALIGLLRPRSPAFLRASLAVALQFFAWRALWVLAPWWPGPASPPELMPVWALAVTALAALSRRPGPTPEHTTPPAATQPPLTVPATSPPTTSQPALAPHQCDYQSRQQ